MQRWTRPTQCIFCQSRASIKYCRLDTGKRDYNAPPTSRKDRSRERPGRPHDIYRVLDRLPDVQRSRKDTVPNESRRRELALDKHAQQIDIRSRHKEIERALRIVKGFYRSVKMSKASDISQMQGLDPYGTLWPRFELLVKASLSSSGSHSRTAGWIGELISAPNGTIREDAEREVRFAFMDFVLDNTENKHSTPKAIDLRYPTEWYPDTRQIQRVIHLHVGPTNSGKTYTALKKLEQAQSGFYAGPLRLLAHEVFSRFNNRGIKCDLVTGDDVRLDESGGVELYASTVEMVDTHKISEVGVVDEIQMMGDNERGWAWTRAVLAAKVKELHLCGEARVVPLIREIVASVGDTLHIHQYERLSPLKVMSKSLKGNLQNLRKGDCIVSFSIVNIHALKRQIELDTGKRCAIIYGGLPPETRAQQAALFNDPDNDYDFLAASDAIGMGLNLSVKRIVFETTQKFNGVTLQRLSIPQIKQIAGRAGRYRTARDDNKAAADAANVKSTLKSLPRAQEKTKSIGLVTCLDEADLPVLQHALSSEGPPLKTAGILPPGEVYEEFAAQLPENTPFEYIMRRMRNTVATSERFSFCDIRDQLLIARAIEEVGNLSIASRLTICASPAAVRSKSTRNEVELVLVALAKAIAADKGVTVADIPEVPLEVLDNPMSADRNYLAKLESLHKSLILYLWLSYRFPRILRDQDMAVQAKQMCEEKINTTLLKFSANPALRERLAGMRKSSELLSAQTRARGGVVDMPLIMNPDQTVEQMDSAQMQGERDQREADEGEVGLEEKVEVDGELDLGNDGSIEELDRARNDLDTQDQESGGRNDTASTEKSLNEPQRAGGSG